ncbi:MAG: DUF3604 domain-containing protein [Ruminococcaceae bacterium]|nr:DUF3604 domain-containing protein [Oscillospiraceae bacterium]
MKNPERKIAKRYDTPNRCEGFTKRVYSGSRDDRRALYDEIFAQERSFYPPKSEYNIYFGELHGHTCLSDGVPTVDEYFTHLRDVAKLDFGALTDHDHGGVGKPELFGELWEYIRSKAKEYNHPGKFTTILAYERDSYPWYNNMIVYYGNHEGQMLRGKTDGEITREELSEYLSRQDVLLVPHDTYSLEAGCDFMSMPENLFTSLIEVYARGDGAEYFGNPYNVETTQCEGGFWQDALKRGAKMGCIAASDDHALKNGVDLCEYDDIRRFPGITGVLAKQNTLEEIFAALKARRCYGFTGGRVYMDFRIDGHYMGEEYTEEKETDRAIYWNIDGGCEIKYVTLVKNCRDYMKIRRNEQMIFDYKAENDTDVYYLRAEFCDGRCAWSSPVWVNKIKG